MHRPQRHLQAVACVNGRHDFANTCFGNQSDVQRLWFSSTFLRRTCTCAAYVILSLSQGSIPPFVRTVSQHTRHPSLSLTLRSSLSASSIHSLHNLLVGGYDPKKYAGQFKTIIPRYGWTNTHHLETNQEILIHHWYHRYVHPFVGPQIAISFPTLSDSLETLHSAATSLPKPREQRRQHRGPGLPVSTQGLPNTTSVTWNDTAGLSTAALSCDSVAVDDQLEFLFYPG